MSRVRYSLLCEDEAHARFMRKFMDNVSGDFRLDRVIQVSSGKGSGEQFVRETFPAEIKEMRRKNYQTNLGLIVITDSDLTQVKQRVQKLNASLRNREMSSIESHELVLLVIPKWCLETWIVHLISGSATENENCQTYKNQIESKDYLTAAKQFASKFRTPPDTWLPAMKHCAAEVSKWLDKFG